MAKDQYWRIKSLNPTKGFSLEEEDTGEALFCFKVSAICSFIRWKNCLTSDLIVDFFREDWKRLIHIFQPLPITRFSFFISSFSYLKVSHLEEKKKNRIEPTLLQKYTHASGSYKQA